MRLQLTALTVELRNIAKILPDATPLKFTKWAVSLVLKRFSKFCSVISVKNNRLCSPSQRKLQKSDLTKRKFYIWRNRVCPIKAGFHKVKPRLSSKFKYLDDLICTTPRLCQKNMTPVALRGRGTTSTYNCFPATGLYFKSKVLASVGRGSTETTRLQHGSSTFGDTHAKGGGGGI